MGKSLETTKGSVWPLFLTAHAVLVEQIEARLAAASYRRSPGTTCCGGWNRRRSSRLRMSELADKVVLSRSNLTRLVDRLEEAGLVARERSAEDRRGAYAVLTEQGRDLRKRMWPAYQAAIRELFESRLSETEADLMATILRRLLDAARDVAPSGPVRGRGEQSPVRLRHLHESATVLTHG